MILRNVGNYPLDYIASYLHNPNDHSVNLHRREILETCHLHSSINTISYVHRARNAKIPQNPQQIISLFLAMLIQCPHSYLTPLFFFNSRFCIKLKNYIWTNYTPEFPTHYRYMLRCLLVFNWFRYTDYW
jgi:hypothetical protein